MRTVQETSQQVIDEGHYATHVDRSEFMCWALCFALMSDDIELDEFSAAKRAIDEYLDELGGGALMSYSLHHAGFETEFRATKMWAAEHGREFYYNWDDRPRKESV